MKSPTLFYLMLSALALTVSIGSCYGQCDTTTNSNVALMNLSKPSKTTSRVLTITGKASWYDVKSCKKERWGKRQPRMSNGKILKDSAMTCAMPTNLMTVLNIRLNDPVQITSGTNVVTVTVTDHGPNKKCQRAGTVIDLTPAAMIALAGEAGIKAGRIKVRVERYE